MVLTTACNDTDYAYDEQQGVDVGGWNVSDTLWFPVEVLETPRLSQPLEPNVDYRLELSVRHTSTYPYQELPLRFMVQPMDTTGGLHHVPVSEDDSLRVWTYADYHIFPTLVADSTHWIGEGWGSLCQAEFRVLDVRVLFPHSGYYRIGLVQQTSDTLLSGIYSVGVSLY